MFDITDAWCNHEDQNINIFYRTFLCGHTIVCMFEKSEGTLSSHFHRYKIPLLMTMFVVDDMIFTEVW